jgi:O-antigen ligase
LRTLSIALPRAAVDAFLPYTSFVVIVAMLFGGGARQGLWSDALVELAALPLLAWALFRLTPSQLGRGGPGAIVLLGAMLALPLLQLIPMPPVLWSSLPGRGEIAEAYDTAGMTLPWLPVSLDPSATWFALLSSLPAAAVFLAMLSLEQRSRRILITLIFLVILASVLLDMLQIVDGINSPLRFYEITNMNRAVGFFANSNHNAAVLYSVIPFATAWAIGLTVDHRRNRAIGLACLAVLILMIIIGVTLTSSRAGMALLFIAGLFGLLVVWRHDRAQSGRPLFRIAIGATVVALLVAFQFGFAGLMERVEAEGSADLRWSIAQVSSQAAVANLPLGSGFGTFVPVYDKFAPRTLLQERYVNHAHDDWLELWLTGGVPAVVIFVGFLAWFAAATVRLWSSSEQPRSVLDLAIARGAPMVIVLLLLHSVVDYPLRTEALMVLFAIACAYLIPWRGTAATKIPAGIESYVPESAGQTRTRYQGLG